MTILCIYSLLFLNILFLYSICSDVLPICINMCMTNAHEDLKRALDLLEEELQTTVNCIIRGLELKP